MIEAHDWRVMRAKRYNKVAFHIVACTPATDDTIISGAIKKWDADTAIAITDKGEKIRLVGEPGFNRAADNNWERWCNRKHIDDPMDVSSRYWKGRVSA